MFISPESRQKSREKTEPLELIGLNWLPMPESKLRPVG
jgi:hypothetical protein